LPEKLKFPVVPSVRILHVSEAATVDAPDTATDTDILASVAVLFMPQENRQSAAVPVVTVTDGLDVRVVYEVEVVLLSVDT
jgi:hypothetical protein